MKRTEGIIIAKKFRDALLEKGYPVHRVLLFGSVARDQATEDSDLDLAIICDPFRETRQEENIAMRALCWDIDIRIEPFSLHQDDFQKPFFALPYEVEREGIAI
ncbi:MAG TPA: nucleotidyltransferase domain-containing protein [Candidatus Peribacteraceae bacterium]|nr:nucleotidyltransferase domain-containing protein [Candidatus Peribacteraceae bacterium]